MGCHTGNPIFLSVLDATQSNQQLVYIFNWFSLLNELISPPKHCLTKQFEFSQFPPVLSLSGLFYEKDLVYTYEDYIENLRQTKEFAESHPNYTVKLTTANAFRNMQIVIHEGEWVMVSKGKSPAIHFVIRHPKLRNAIENMIVPVTEE